MATRTLRGAKVLLVGDLPDAVDAARRLDLDVRVLGEKPRRRPVGYPRGCYGSDVVSAARELFPDGKPAAVVAVTEGGVAPACEIRGALGLPGPGPEQAAALTDKAAMKQAVRAAGVSCADWVRLDEHSEAAAVADQLGIPVVVKAATGAGGRGLVLARDVQALAAAIQPGLVAEAFVRGLEMSVETLLVDGEVRFRNFTRYVEPRWVNLVPATVAAKTARAVNELADRAHAALGLTSGLTHLEVFLYASGPVFGEIAARPPGGRIMDLIRLAYGFDPWEAVLKVALGRRPRIPRRAKQHASVCFLHPGAGRVEAIRGAKLVANLDGVVEVRCRREPGDVLAARETCAERVVDIVAVGSSAEVCLHHLGDARRQVHVELAP